MKLLDTIEGAMETVIEGLFRRGSRGSIQPVEIGRNLIRVMESQKRVSIARTYAPNCYDIYLHPDQWIVFRSMKNTLSKELKGFLEEKAEKEQLSFIGDLSIRFVEDTTLDVASIRVSAEYLEDNEDPTSVMPNSQPKTGASSHTMIYLGDSEMEQTPALDVQDTNGEVRVVPIHSDFSIGRTIQCSLTLNDHNVSRIHAWIHKRDKDWIISDNNSTNGTFVNGDQIKEHSLKLGDRVQIGTTIMIFEDQSL